MPTYRITSPDGKKYKVTAPEGATKEQALERIKQQHQAVVTKPTLLPEASGTSRFLQGVGGEALKAAGGIAGMIPGVSQDNPIAQMGQEGIEKATGFAGGAGKIVGGMLPYIALPEAKLPALLASAGIGAATQPGSLAERAESGLLSGVGMGVGQVLPGVVKSVGRGAANVIGELGTHTGGNTIKEAALSGFKGGAKQKAFKGYINEELPLSDIAKLAKKGLANISKKDSAEYVKRMEQIAQDKTILPYVDIEKALKNAGGVGTFEGHVVNPAAVNVQNKLKPIIQEWSGQPYVKNGRVNPGFAPAKAHTIEGLDALKKRVYNEYKATQQGTPERIVARDVYTAVKNEISKQSPEYKKLMEFTQKNIENKKGIMKELSLGENAGDNAALRKLLSIPRNNANTNFGNRVAMGRELEENGANNLMAMLSGSSLSSLKPRGIGGIVSGGAGVGALASLATGNPMLASSMLAALLAQSPKIMGKTALKAGQAARYAKKLPFKQGIISGMQQANEKEKK